VTLENNPFLALLLITALAAIIPVLANRFKRVQIPLVVGEIFAGIIIGHSGFNLVEPSTTLTFLAEFGFAYLMFLSGLEVDFNLLLPSSGQSRKEAWKGPMPQALLMLAGTIGLALGAAMLLERLGIVESPMLVALILSTTSLGVVVPVLKERGLLGSRYGQFMLVASSIADFVTLILLTIAIAVRRSGLTLDLLLIPVLLIAFGLIARWAQRLGSIPILQNILDELSSATSQIRVRGAFALMVAWVVAAEALGVELILGAFLAGALAGLVAGSHDSSAREKLDAIGYGFFIPIFFIMVGVEFNLNALVESPQALLLVPLLVVIAYLVKIIPGLLLRLNFPWRETLAGGLLISSRLSLIIAASSIALSIGVITEAVNAAIVLLAIISCTISPMLFNRIYPASDEDQRRGIIIIGQDQLAEFLIERLLPGGEPIAVICPDPSRVRALRRLGVDIIDGCLDLRESMVNAGAYQARVLVDLTMSEDETTEVCRLARQDFNIPMVVSRITNIELVPDLQRIGVKVVQPTLATAMALEGALRFPSIFDVLLQQDRESIAVREISMANPSLTGLKLSQVRLPGDALIVSLQREGSVMVPHGDSQMELNDRIGLIGSPQSVERAIGMLTTRT
jgi:Kef-type K+ transport system membrane component KefB/Trk K+ transport system NAD-binding subunit